MILEIIILTIVLGCGYAIAYSHGKRSSMKLYRNELQKHVVTKGKLTTANFELQLMHIKTIAIHTENLVLKTKIQKLEEKKP